MSDLYGTERLIINQLIDHNIFTSTIDSHTTKATADAIRALKRPATQQRISNFFNELVGCRPGSFQDNFSLLLGADQLPASTVHVLLATFKAIINLPEAQNRDRIVLAETVVRQVNSEVTELDDREIQRQINAIFVDQLELLVLDRPETPPSDQAVEVAEYWDVSPDFNFVAQCLVDQLMPQLTDNHITPQLTPIQQVNRQLLMHRYISRNRLPELWQTLTAHVDEIAAQWAPLSRFYLELGDHYALLLDQTRQPSGAQPFVVAIAVAKLLGAGVHETELNELIKKMVSQMTTTVTITTTQVKQAMSDFDLAEKRDGLIIATPLIERFAVTDEEEVEHD